eukprot:s828_g20.t1
MTLTGDGAKRRLTSNGRAGISPAFLSLVDQLVHQHKMELATSTHRRLKSFELPSPAQGRTSKQPWPGHGQIGLKRLRMSFGESAAEREVQRGTDWRQESASSRTSNGAKGASPVSASLKPQHYLQRSPTVARVMCHHHGDLKEMNASKLLDAFDMQKLLEKDDGDPLEVYQDRASKMSQMRPMKTEATFQTFDWDEMEKESCLTKLQVFLQSTRYEITISVVLALNVLWMAFELELEGGAAGVPLGVYDRGINVSDWNWIPASILADGVRKDAFRLGDTVFAYIFIADVVIRLLVLRRKFFQVCLNYVDIAVSMTSLAEELPIPPPMFKLLRIGKLARAIRMITMTTMMLSLQLLIKCLAASRGMLFWSFCLMSFVQCVAGMILGTLCQDYVQDPHESFRDQDTTKDPKIREEVFRYYGTLAAGDHSWILFANWSPPCRILVENVNEWFSVFFLIYRCVLGFAATWNSVFVQQTMKTASSDEDLAFRQKQKDIAAYTRKVRKLFQTMDASGDGTINLEEFAKLVTNPKLKFWMSQLELEYHDLMSLFEFLDNGEAWQRPLPPRSRKEQKGRGFGGACVTRVLALPKMGGVLGDWSQGTGPLQAVTFLPDRVRVVQKVAQSLRAEGLMTHAMACVSGAFVSPMRARDGEITLTEFIEGAGKLRGQAKALDIWRMETKVEVLFEEVLNMLRSQTPPVEFLDPEEVSPPVTRTSSVQEILSNSAYKHLGTPRCTWDLVGLVQFPQPTESCLANQWAGSQVFLGTTCRVSDIGDGIGIEGGIEEVSERSDI